MLLSRAAFRVGQPLLECAILFSSAFLYLPFAFLHAVKRLFLPSDPRAIKDPRCVAISGASSGIGAALALKYSRPGVLLAITGRNAESLKRVAEECIAQGAEVRATVLEIRNTADVRKWIEATDDERPIDVLFANAGTLVGLTRKELGPGATDAEVAVEVHRVNVLGTVATCYNAFDRMKTRGRGQIVITGSVAAEWHNSGNYAASKAALRTVAISLREYARPSGVSVTLLEPGYVRSNIAQALGGEALPWLIGADKAAEIIADGVAHADPQITFPLPMYLMVRFLGTLPVPLWSLFPLKTQL